MNHPSPPGPSHPGPSRPGAAQATAPVPLYGPDFAADPYAVYERLRAYGACAPVELAPGVTATLVTDYRAALEVLHDTDTYGKDPRVWQQTIPPDSEVLPMMGWRPNALFNDGEIHARYRRVTNDSLAMIEPHELRDLVHRSADSLIRGFASRGEVDLIGAYARRLPPMIFTGLFGVSDESSRLLLAAMEGMFDAEAENAHAANDEFTRLMVELVTSKREKPGPDVTSWMLAHPLGLSDEEVIGQLVTCLGAGSDPLTNLMGNALARMLSDPRYYRTVSSGALTVTDALAHVLWYDAPLMNYSTHYPRRDVDLHGTWIPAHTPVLISYAAANTASRPPEWGHLPAVAGGGPRADTGAHLAFAAGPHACPARNPSLLIAGTAIDRLTGWLCDIHLSVPFDQLTWRPGPFHRALEALPARFTPIAPDQKGTSPWNASPLSSSIPPDETSPARPRPSAPRGRPSASSSPAPSRPGPSPATP